MTPSEVFWVPLGSGGRGVGQVDSTPAISCVLDPHDRQVFQTIVLVQCGAKNRASFDDIRGANGPKVVGGGGGGCG